MTEIIPLLICLEPYLSSTLVRQLRHIVFAMLCIPNRASMLGLSRWTEKGGSYRTLNRLYQAPIDWLKVHWCLFQTHLLHPAGEYILAGDEVVIRKAGQQTHGVGRFFSGLAQKVIPSISFIAISIIDVQTERSYPLYTQQMMPVMPAQKHGEAEKPKRPRGRPKGSKNHAKAEPTLSPLLTLLQGMLTSIWLQIALLKIKHIVLDGKFGNYPSTWMIRHQNLHIISKLRQDAALYLLYAGEAPSRGPKRREGDKLNYQKLPADRLVSSEVEGDYRTDIYQLEAYHRDYPDALNVVVIVKTHITSNKRGHVVLFSTDGDLSAEKIVRSYRLRFQIEFNFRDAKQYWGLEDFMNVTEQGVTNAANLAFLMVNLSQVMLKPYRDHQPDFSVLDLKAQFRARRYLSETIKMLPETPEPDLISRIWRRLARFGGIRSRPILDFAA
jgi:putative transposase